MLRIRALEHRTSVRNFIRISQTQVYKNEKNSINSIFGSKRSENGTRTQPYSRECEKLCLIVNQTQSRIKLNGKYLIT